MNLAFTGDINLFNIEKYTEDPFRNISSVLQTLNCVISSEAVFLPDSYNKEPIKNKCCLRQSDRNISYFRQLNPYLVNISNNHANDYGNYGICHSKNVFDNAGINIFGAGDISENHNLFAIDQEKVLFLSYTTRNTDETGSILFNEKNVGGAKEFSIDLFKNQIEGYDDYIKIVLLHWGVEYRHYPLPEQRLMSRNIINAGADLIIGNHPHVIQGYENYKGKWIFYSLGHFLFPNYNIKIKNKTYSYVSKESNNVSLLPVFRLDNNTTVKLQKIHTLKADKNFVLSFSKKKYRYNLFLLLSPKRYAHFYHQYVNYLYLAARLKLKINRLKQKLLT